MVRNAKHNSTNTLVDVQHGRLSREIFVNDAIHVVVDVHADQFPLGIFMNDPPKPTVSPLTIPLVYCHIKSFQQASSVAMPLPGGENRRDGRASHHVEL